MGTSVRGRAESEQIAESWPTTKLGPITKKRSRTMFKFFSVLAKLSLDCLMRFALLNSALRATGTNGTHALLSAEVCNATTQKVAETTVARGLHAQSENLRRATQGRLPEKEVQGKRLTVYVHMNNNYFVSKPRSSRFRRSM